MIKAVTGPYYTFLRETHRDRERGRDRQTHERPPHYHASLAPLKAFYYAFSQALRSTRRVQLQDLNISHQVCGPIVCVCACVCVCMRACVYAEHMISICVYVRAFHEPGLRSNCVVYLGNIHRVSDGARARERQRVGYVCVRVCACPCQCARVLSP